MTKLTFEARIENLHAADMQTESEVADFPDAPGEIMEFVNAKITMDFPGNEEEARRILLEMDGSRFPVNGRGIIHIKRILSVEP